MNGRPDGSRLPGSPCLPESPPPAGRRAQPPLAVLRRAYELLLLAREMTALFERESATTSRYVHATSRGHEAVQIALGLQLRSSDYLYPYYRDDALLLAIGLQPRDLMLQLLAKREDPFSGGRMYYSHPSLRRDDLPKIPFQSSAAGMQAIAATGAAMGLLYLRRQGLAKRETGDEPVVVCSSGDAAFAAGEVAEALQMAALKQAPVVFLVQDNGWCISARSEELRAADAASYVRGFGGIEARTMDGSDFAESYLEIGGALAAARAERRPLVLHATVPLLTHHTSGVRMESYRDDLEAQSAIDPAHRLRSLLAARGVDEAALATMARRARLAVAADFAAARRAAEPDPSSLSDFVFAPTRITEERGTRRPATGGRRSSMAGCASSAVRELLSDHPECLFYGQDVGSRLGGVFREATGLGAEFGPQRVFNMPVMEAFIVGSTAGMSAVGCRPVVEIQFADFLWAGLNQLVGEVSRSCYFSQGKWPVQAVFRVPVGSYGGGGPYHSASIESVLLRIPGLKIAYPSCGADLKGLLKAAFHDPNPVVVLEHKGLYWSRLPHTDGARSIEPDADYVLPLGRGVSVLEAERGRSPSVAVVTWGLGVHWALAAAAGFPGRVEIIDLRSLQPLDEELVMTAAARHHRCLVVTEEPLPASFAESLTGRIQRQVFWSLDAPVLALGAHPLPAVPLNTLLEQEMLPSAARVADAIGRLLAA